MAWFGKVRELHDALRAQEARIVALEVRAERFDGALRELGERAGDHARDVSDITEKTRRLADEMSQALSALDAVPRHIEDQRSTLVGLRNQIVKLGAEVEQHAKEAETQTRALFARIEAMRSR